MPQIADEFAGTAQPPGRPLTLWYRRPASNWNAALPVGNGRLGCMVRGGVSVERLWLNEDSLWAGGLASAPVGEEGVPEQIAKGIREVRKLMFEDKLAEAEQLLWQTIRAPKRHHLNTFGCSQLLGLLDLHFSDTPSSAAGYRRDLDLDAAVHRVRYSKDGVAFTREVFASAADQVIVVRLEADKPGSLSFVARLSRGERAETRAAGSDALVMKGQAYALKSGMKFIARVKARAEGGRAFTKENQLHVEGADAVTILVACATDYLPEPPTFRGNPHEEVTAKQIEAAAKKSYTELRDAHMAAHRDLFRRMTLDLGRSPAARTALPMDERVTKAGDAGDPEFLALLFQYGRYLLISSSRPGGLPAHLQGLWIGDFNPMWNGDYHLDLNIQMCYWAAGPCNIAECALPVVDLVRCMVPSGRRTARRSHGVGKGWVAHLATNVHGYTSPLAHPRYGYAAGCAAWLMQTLWEHYAYTLDKEYLRRVWPLFREQGEFWLEWLVKDPETGRLVSGPGSSPENSFGSPSGNKVGLCMGTAFDQQCAWEIFTEILEAAEALGIEDDHVRRIREARADLLGPQICSESGAILEWTRQRYGTGGKHRHRSHIVGLYPGRMITVEHAPEWAAAARRALELRGPGGPPWTPAWDMSFWARL
ncbi:MAG: glycoside hydrolase family 95 protein, partial [Planctomycetota bacterium]